MELISKTTKLNVEELKSRLLGRKTTKPRFRFPLTGEQAEDLLLAAYEAEVAYRKRAYIQDNAVLENVSKLAKFLISDNSKFGIMFAGVCGNGKTTLLYALRSAISLLSDCKGFEGRPSLSVVDAKDVALYARDLQGFKELKSRPMVAIEDMGREPTEVLDYGNVLNPVIDLLEYRYNEQLFTAITTNLTAEQITQKYGRRIADRFNEMLEVIVFKNGTYRK